MRLPIGRHMRLQQLAQLFYGLTFQQCTQSGLALIVEVGQLGDADIGKVLWTQTKEVPGRKVHWRQREFMSQVEVFVAQFSEVALVKRSYLIALRDTLQLEQSCLSHEDSLYLKQVIAMLVYSMEGDVLCPHLKSLAIDAEAIVACQGDEIAVFP